MPEKSLEFRQIKFPQLVTANENNKGPQTKFKTVLQ